MAVLTAAVASGVSGLFAVTLLRRWWVRGRTNRALLFWGLALVMFCAAAVGLLAGVVGGWTSAEFRAFYLFGAVLNVPWLALGSIAVNARAPVVSRWTGVVMLAVAAILGRGIGVSDTPELWIPGTVLAALWGLLLLAGNQRVVVDGAALVLVAYSVIGIVAVLVADYVAPLPRTGLPEGAELFSPAVRGVAVGANIVGSLTVIVSALVSSAAMVWSRPERSADRLVLQETRQRGYVEAIARWIFRGRTGAPVAHLVRGNLLIALGVLLAATGGILSFLGDTVGHAIGFTVGVVVMYLGFVRTTRPVAAGSDPGHSASGASGATA